MTRPTTLSTADRRHEEHVVRGRPGGARRRPPGPRASITRSAHDVAPRALDAAPTSRGEVVAALGVAAVPVERRARGREQHDVAGARRAAPRRVTASCIDPARTTSRPVAREQARRLRPRPSPIATTARSRSAAPARHREVEALVAAAREQHDRRRTPASAARVAWGFVAFESSKYRTPQASPTGATRWGSLRKFSSAALDPAARRADVDARPPRRRARSCGRGGANARSRRVARAPRRQDRRSRRRRSCTRRRGARRSRTRRGVRRAAAARTCDHRVVGVEDEQVVGRW